MGPGEFSIFFELPNVINPLLVAKWTFVSHTVYAATYK